LYFSVVTALAAAITVVINPAALPLRSVHVDATRAEGDGLFSEKTAIRGAHRIRKKSYAKVY